VNRDMAGVHKKKLKASVHCARLKSEEEAGEERAKHLAMQAGSKRGLRN